jgi:hypothetical protein
MRKEVGPMSEAATLRYAAREYLQVSVIAASYVLVGAALCWSRLAGLDQSFWHDEIFTVVHYVREGPREILFGTYVPNNHELFSLVGWATAALVGSDSEAVLRVWSAVPFIAGVVLVAAWLHTRVGALEALLYASLTTLSPLLVDLSRQARGYGLAFFAMSLLIAGALEARRSARTWAIVAVAAGGLIGTFTLPIFGVGFLATVGVLLADPLLRRRAAVVLVTSMVAIGAWYAPHADDLLTSSRQEFGAPIPALGIITAPVDQIIFPAFVENAATPRALWLLSLLVIGFPLIVGTLARGRRDAIVLGAGVVATLLVVWLGRLYLSPRFVSFLLVPLFILLASGIARALARPHSLRAPGGVLVALSLLALVVTHLVPPVVRATQFPREAHRDAARTIEREAARTRVVLAYVRHPLDLAFYLDRPVHGVATSEVRTRVCASRAAIVYVTQPTLVPAVDIPCLARRGTEHFQVEQRVRGGRIDIWLVRSATD